MGFFSVLNMICLMGFPNSTYEETGGIRSVTIQPYMGYRPFNYLDWTLVISGNDAFGLSSRRGMGTLEPLSPGSTNCQWYSHGLTRRGSWQPNVAEAQWLGEAADESTWFTRNCQCQTASTGRKSGTSTLWFSRYPSLQERRWQYVDNCPNTKPLAFPDPF